MSTPSWLQEYQQPFTKQYNVRCHSNHVHPNNIPAAGIVLVRLNESSQLELLLDLRSSTVEHPNTWGFIGGDLNCINDSYEEDGKELFEEPLAGALRMARGYYGISAYDIYPLGLQYKRDHGGVKFLTYNYIFAVYNGHAPSPLTKASERSQWFALDALPDNLQLYVQEDLPVLRETLSIDVASILLKAKCMGPNPIDSDGDVSMSDSGEEEHSLGFLEPINSFSYHFNMATNGAQPSTPPATPDRANQKPKMPGQVDYPDLEAELQKLDIGAFKGINSLTPEQRAKLTAQATEMQNKASTESKEATRKPEKAGNSIFSQFFTYIGPKSKLTAAAPAAAAATPAATQATPAAAAAATLAPKTQPSNKDKRPTSSGSMLSLFSWGVKQANKDVSTINSNGKRELSQQTNATDEPDSKKVKTQQQQQTLQPSLMPNVPLAIHHQTSQSMPAAAVKNNSGLNDHRGPEFASAPHPGSP
ncbi:hypothetical protein FHL15_008306 [Xylaria flabelliformis]|uniref:Nudix hydrolase domain-containing protein n=1 Tax=Xylaria flabelliformis TaxID=2512241 RepID=A0A553HRZ7_9PEZI|nr:hypothetical protein FHL15_008306 [Xylaria flabelliformis]